MFDLARSPIRCLPLAWAASRALGGALCALVLTLMLGDSFLWAQSPLPPIPDSAIENSDVPSGAPEGIHVPIGRRPKQGEIQLSSQGDRINLVVRNASLSEVLAMLAQERNLNVVFNDTVEEKVSITLRGARLEDVLTSILTVAGYRWTVSRGIIHVTRADQTDLPAHVQGRKLAVYPLDFTAATDILEAIQGFLSPVGKAYIQESNPLDNLRTREAVVVEDRPDVLKRVEELIAQIDQPPRQVLIQVHVLQVELKDDEKHGVNFDAILRIAETPIEFQTVGFANENATTASFLSLKGHDLSTVIELLQTTTDAKTIASPRVLCLNGQESRIQVGEQLGFRVTTTTQTSTLESVEFLDLGVVLRVTPRISRDNRVMMMIKPQVSSGRVNPLTGLPEEETTEVETNVLLHDGQAIVIGGLIQEDDTDIQSKVPKLGDAWRVGKLFQRREATKERSEVIITLVPYILPYQECLARRDWDQVNQSATPLFHGPLIQNDRPWEPRLSSAWEQPVRLPCVEDCCDCRPGPSFYPPGEYVVPPAPGPQTSPPPTPEAIPIPQPTSEQPARGLFPRMSRIIQGTPARSDVR